METQELLKKLNKIKDIPTLPAIAMEVNNMLQDQNVSIESLSKTIEKDQAIAAKILKLVNSAFFGVRSKVGNISEAVVLLGFNSVRNVVVSVSLIKTFSNNKADKKYDIKDLWKHSVGVAIISKHLAKLSHLQDPDDCFVCGLLHDIGKVIIIQNLKDIFEVIMQRMDNDHLSFYEAEKKELPFGHAKIGAILAKKWQLPQSIIDTVSYHHILSPNAANLELAMIVYAANIIANTFMADSMHVAYGGKTLKLSKMDPKAVKKLRPQLVSASDWFPEILETIQEGCKFFMQNN